MKHLVTPRLLLRPFSPGDLADLRSLYRETSPIIGSHDDNPMPLEAIDMLLEKMMDDFEKHGYGMFAVIERKEKRFIGHCGLQPIEKDDVMELHIRYLHIARGKGYATEAAMEVLRAAFSDWGLTKIVASVSHENKILARVLEKIGMVNCGRSELYAGNLVLYAIEHQEKARDIFFLDEKPRSSSLNMAIL